MMQPSALPVTATQEAIGRLSDDQLGSLAVALVVSELRWTPDVAPAVLDRISRDAVAYPDHFDRRSRPHGAPTESVFEEPTVGRTVRRLLILAAVVVLVAVLVLAATTARALNGSICDTAVPGRDGSGVVCTLEAS